MSATCQYLLRSRVCKCPATARGRASGKQYFLQRRGSLSRLVDLLSSKATNQQSPESQEAKMRLEGYDKEPTAHCHMRSRLHCLQYVSRCFWQMDMCIHMYGASNVTIRSHDAIQWSLLPPGCYMSLRCALGLCQGAPGVTVLFLAVLPNGEALS